MTLPRVTCLIPAHDEAARIAGVLAAVRGHPLVSRTLVIDDGSTDGTAALARRLGVDVLGLSPNRGKSAALAEGLARVTTSHVMLLDADLTGLSPDDVSRLIQPVLTGRAGVALSLRGNAPLPWQALGVDYITGERVLPMALMRPILPEMAALPRFGLEVFMNDHIRASGLAVAVVPWPRVASPAKRRKRGMVAGLRADLGMLADILRTAGPVAPLRQIAYLRGARV
jgi:glycosyltransferase involved in cell wall biosynthesis